MQENGFLSEEQKMVRDMVRDFCEREIAPVAAEIDEGRFPAEVVKSMGELGLMGLTVPDSYGGGGADPVSMALATEEVAAACPSTSAIFAAHNSLVCDPLYLYGSEWQKEEYLYGLASGERIGAFALTEPGAGSDAAALTTSAVREGGVYRVSGVKRFITSGKQAGLCLLFAVTDRSLRHKGLSAFLVPREAQGFEVVRSEDKMGMHGCSISELRFDAVELPEENRMGEEGQGFELAMRILDSGRIIVAAQGLGFARACLDASVDYARERETFGVPIKDHQPAGLEARRYGRARPRRAPADLEGGAPQNRGRALLGRSRHRQGVRHRRRPAQRRRGRPAPRGQRLHARVSRGALLPGVEGDADLRGHERDTPPGHRQAPARLKRTRPTAHISNISEEKAVLRRIHAT